MLWSFALAIGSQLHFFGMFVLITVSVVLILLRGKLWKLGNIKSAFSKNNFKKLSVFAGTFILIFTLIYAPVIVSDAMRNGENTKNFFRALSAKPEDKPLLDKIAKNASENVKYYCLITTSFCNEGKTKDNPFPASLTVIFMLGGIILAARAWRKENDPAKKDFLLLLLIWIGIFFILTIPVSFQLRPRFFILVFAVPFILAGVIFDYFREKQPEKAIYLISALALAILGSNAYGTWDWFREQKSSQSGDVEINRTLILKVKDGVTLGQLQGVVDYMYEHRKNNSTIYYFVKPEHVSPIKYLFYNKHDPSLKYFTLKINKDPNAQYFAVLPSHLGTEPIREKYGDDFSVISSRPFGQIAVYEIDFPNRAVSETFRFNKERKPTDRIFWKDVFGIDNEKKGDIVEIDDYE